jgi:hypothetical protein
VGILSLALFLLAVALDLQSARTAYDNLPESDDDAPSGVKPGA